MLRTATRRAMLYPATVAAESGGWWDVGDSSCIGAWQAKGAASYAASILDLSGNGNTLTPEGTPTWNATDGWTFGGSYTLDTGIVANDNWTIIVRATATAQYGIAMGVDGSRRLYIGFWGTGMYYGCGATAAVQGAAATSGVFAMAANQPYRNGSTDGATVGTPTGASTGVNMEIGGNGKAGASTSKLNGNGQAAAMYNRALTFGEIATVSAAMAAL